MNEIKLLRTLPSTKDGINALAKGIVGDIEENGTNTLDYYILLKTLSSLEKAVKDHKKFKEYLLEDAHKYVEKTFTHAGCKFTIQNRPRYKYEVCKDEVWDELQREKQKLDEKIKEREAFLKALKEPVADVNYGNTIYPPSVEGGEVVAVTLA